MTLQSLSDTWNFLVFTCMTYHRVYNTSGVNSGAGNPTPSRAPKFTPGFQWGSCCSIFTSRQNSIWTKI